MSSRWFTIVNGTAGSGRCGAQADAALAELQRDGFQIERNDTTGPGHATELAREAFRSGHRNFLCVGGDGTTYEIINGLCPEAIGAKPQLALLPLGTGNSFLLDFGIDDPKKAAAAIRSKSKRPIDVVKIEHEDGTLYSLNILSIGFSASVGALTNRRFKGMGAAGYPMAVVSSLIGLGPRVFPLYLDGAQALDERPVALLSFCNSRYTGGSMMMAPHANPGDGKLDVVRVGAMSRFELLKTFPRIYRGEHLLHPAIDSTPAKRVDFKNMPKVDVMVDGEVLSLSLRSLEVVPSALEVLV
jgi:diacylglycerol kinase (ATP)